MRKIPVYKPKNKIRIVTATSLFDGHDVAINIMRRILQATGVEVIHLGHDRAVEELVNCAIQEDAHAIAITSYQGGHIEYFKYMYDLLKERGAETIKIFGGGGGVILLEEIKELHEYGIARIYSPDDGREMGLQGMINDMVEKCDHPTGLNIEGLIDKVKQKDKFAIARLISAAENFPEKSKTQLAEIHKMAKNSKIPVLGVTGPGGAGKSSVIDELIQRFLIDFPGKTVGIISVDPTKHKTGGALLGDRIRMNSVKDERVYMRSLATRGSLGLSTYAKDAVDILKAAGFNIIILETPGIGQSDIEITQYSDMSLYIMTPEYGAPTQLEKIQMLDFANIVAINKFDKRGAEDALRDVRKQTKDENIPVYGTTASQFNDPGTNQLYKAILTALINETGGARESKNLGITIIPPQRTRYLAEISETIRNYNNWAKEQKEVAQKLYSLHKTITTIESKNITPHPSSSRGLTAGSNNIVNEKTGFPAFAGNDSEHLSEGIIKELKNIYKNIEIDLDPQNKQMLEQWETKKAKYKELTFKFKVRDKELAIETHNESLSHTMVPKIALPKYEAWGDQLHWQLQENVPGEFPYTAGLFPFKREGEDPIRMFAGEGGPERTNCRFHYLSYGMPAKRLSTAFDSVTLYGHDPEYRPDIYGKIGNSGVSICCLDDAKKLYLGFNLVDPKTSVSLTINGPAPILLAFFLNTAIDQQCEIYIKEKGLEQKVEQKIKEIFAQKGAQRPVYHGELPKGNDGLGLMLLGVTGDQVLPKDIYAEIKDKTLRQVRGTVQADILKEDQAQNTCIFSTEFALRMMGDVQQYFVAKGARNFYSVSISGYHIAEAGANPITQLAFTLANGFTYVEYFLHRGMDINEFGPNLSFFFSNGVDAEYAVIGRVARRIWAKAMKEKYHANPRAQMLKYHIQTSGRSLHAQEIGFNDIRTTLQALYAIYDNCNSLHTNAYDEAITTPTEESVRRAVAIQLIINRELGLAKNENPLQGSFIIEELTDLVEEAVLMEFDRITERGGVLGAMETMYQRSKIQEESLYYESLKDSGEYPIIGVNTFLDSQGSPTVVPHCVIRSGEEEKNNQINTVRSLIERNKDEGDLQLAKVQETAIKNKNIFEQIMEAVKVCSIGQITNAVFAVGGQYRRNM
jgi:methylmalonyl-CoA mutase